MIKIPVSIKLIAVTKGHSIKEIQEIIKNHTVYAIGESRWQEAATKLQELPVELSKHFIGHLQTNKVKYIVPNFDCIQSIHSLALAEAINMQAKKANKIMPIFLQVNISEDLNKIGFHQDELELAIQNIHKLPNIQLEGLMTITAQQAITKTRQDFRMMKQLQQHFQLPELSMGMSQDWQLAIEEGATMVRIGTALFA